MFINYYNIVSFSMRKNFRIIRIKIKKKNLEEIIYVN